MSHADSDSRRIRPGRREQPQGNPRGHGLAGGWPADLRPGPTASHRSGPGARVGELELDYGLDLKLQLPAVADKMCQCIMIAAITVRVSHESTVQGQPPPPLPSSHGPSHSGPSLTGM